ncbi:MAG: site-2 protease family protein, partial [Candidatus Thermoplasmatota archaeon]|nr:site-2 protease family protein [Candidatus Thermoplasmatota archaeon]
KQKYAGWLAVIIMVFTGWWFFAFIILLLIGVKHPPPLNDESELDFTRKLLFFVAVAILILCFIPFPITSI